MRSGSRKNRPLRSFALLLLLGAVAFAAGCSTAQSPSGSGTNVNHILPSGSSVAGWLVVPSGGLHARTATLDYIAGGGSTVALSATDRTSGRDLNVPCSATRQGATTNGRELGHHAVNGAGPGQPRAFRVRLLPDRPRADFSGGGRRCSASPDMGGAPHPRRPGRPTQTHANTDTANAPSASVALPGPRKTSEPSSLPTRRGTRPGLQQHACHASWPAP